MVSYKSINTITIDFWETSMWKFYPRCSGSLPALMETGKILSHTLKTSVKSDTDSKKVFLVMKKKKSWHLHVWAQLFLPAGVLTDAVSIHAVHFLPVLTLHHFKHLFKKKKKITRVYRINSWLLLQGFGLLAGCLTFKKMTKKQMGSHNVCSTIQFLLRWCVCVCVWLCLLPLRRSRKGSGKSVTLLML